MGGAKDEASGLSNTRHMRLGWSEWADHPRACQRNYAMQQTGYEFHQVEGGAPIKMWTRDVPLDDKARE